MALISLEQTTKLNEAMPKITDVVITYLEQTAPPAVANHAPPSGVKLALMRAQNPPLAFYRYLYSQIGGPHQWISRKSLNDSELAALIHRPEIHIYVLYVDGAPAGFAEIDASNSVEIQLIFFGLSPDFTGMSLGRYFLGETLRLIWAMGPEKVVLETCNLDHPAALPLYQKQGFTVFDQRKGQIELPDAN